MVKNLSPMKSMEKKHLEGFYDEIHCSESFGATIKNKSEYGKTIITIFIAVFLFVFAIVATQIYIQDYHYQNNLEKNESNYSKHLYDKSIKKDAEFLERLKHFPNDKDEFLMHAQQNSEKYERYLMQKHVYTNDDAPVIENKKFDDKNARNTEDDGPELNKRSKRDIEEQDETKDDEEEEEDEGSGNFMSDIGCCKTKEFRKQSRIEGIKTDILDQLRLSEPPNITMPDDMITEAVLQTFTPTTQSPLIDYSNYLKADDDLASTKRAFYFCEGFPRNNRRNRPHQFHCYFKIADILRSHTVRNATIGIYVKKLRLLYEEKTIISEELVKVETITRESSFSLVDKMPITINEKERGTWLEFDLTQQVEEWERSFDSNRGLRVSIEISRHLNQTTSNFALISPTTTTDLQYRPYLDIALVEKKNQVRRNRRHTQGEDYLCQENNAQTQCCRYPLKVNFTSFGWKFITFPKTYDAFYCAGHCNSGEASHRIQNHLNIQATSHIANTTKSNGLCCAPRSFKPLQIIYIDEAKNIRSEVINSMIVQQCGCY